MNEELILLEKLHDIVEDMDGMGCTTQKPFIRLKLMEVISELDERVTKFEQWADQQGVWSEFATEGLLIDENKPWAIEKVSI